MSTAGVAILADVLVRVRDGERSLEAAGGTEGVDVKRKMLRKESRDRCRVFR